MRIGRGREVDVYETAPGIFHVREPATERRLALLVQLADGWYLGARTGGPRRELWQPDGDTERAVVRLFSP